MPEVQQPLAKRSRVSREARIWRVHALKLAGGTDRQIAETLARDPESPVSVTHQQVNHDYHEALRLLEEDYREKATHQRMLANARLERLLAAVWPRAIGSPPSIGAVTEARSIIRDQRALFGLDRELGDPERPFTIDAEVRQIDYRQLTDNELDFFLAVAERLALGDEHPLESPGSPE